MGNIADMDQIWLEKKRNPQKIHGSKPMQYARQQYLDQLIRKKDNGRIKIATGLRRSGKSWIDHNGIQFIGIEDFLLDESLISG